MKVLNANKGLTDKVDNGDNLDQNNETKEKTILVQLNVPESELMELRKAYRLPSYRGGSAICKMAVTDLVAIIKASGLHPVLIAERFKPEPQKLIA